MKIESIKEYLARGGKVVKLQEKDKNKKRSTTSRYKYKDLT